VSGGSFLFTVVLGVVRSEKTRLETSSPNLGQDFLRVIPIEVLPSPIQHDRLAFPSICVVWDDIFFDLVSVLNVFQSERVGRRRWER
jgi:hypothetical protein